MFYPDSVQTALVYIGPSPCSVGGCLTIWYVFLNYSGNFIRKNLDRFRSCKLLLQSSLLRSSSMTIISFEEIIFLEYRALDICITVKIEV